MPKRRRSAVARRTRLQVAADEHADRVAIILGKSLKDARMVTGQLQREASDKAALAASTWSKAETGEGADFTLRTWARLALAGGTSLSVYLARASSADRPRDAVHLANQELLLRTAARGGWRGHPEFPLGDPMRGCRAGDVVLRRPAEMALMEVIDWFEDVGASARDWDRRLAMAEARAIATMPPGQRDPPSVSGCWVVRATRRNRELVARHRAFFAARLPGSSAAWLDALTSPGRPMPPSSALLWVAVKGDRLWAARLGG